MSDEAAAWGKGPAPVLDADGWPASLQPAQTLGKLMLRDVQYHAPAGVYTVLYDGDGRLDFSFDAKVVSRDQGKVLVKFTPTANIACSLTFSSYCGDNGLWMSVSASAAAGVGWRLWR